MKRACAISIVKSPTSAARWPVKWWKTGNGFHADITVSNVNDYLGIIKFRDFFAEKKNEVGLTTGLAWTEVGGQVLSTEATLMQGKGRLTLTGKLGDVMQESAHAAMSYVRSRSHLFGLPRIFTGISIFTFTCRKERFPKTVRPPESRSALQS